MSKLLSTLFTLLFIMGLPLAQAETPRIVLGEDERRPVLDTLQAPYSTIGQIGDFCTASLVAPDILITAAHCSQEIFNPDFIFAAARFGKETPFGVRGWEKMVIPSCYTLQGRMDCDFAFIFLSAPLESISSFNLTEQFSPELPLIIAGYPADKVDQMWESTCLATTEGNRLFYDCDTVGGMSGSPILQKQGEQYNLVGIHTRGEEGINSGVLLTSHFSSILDRAKEELQNGQSSKELTWYANPLLPQNQTPNVTVYIKNDCKESIVAKVLYKDIRGRMTNRMRFIGRKSKKILDKVFGDEVYIYFQTQTGSYTSSGNAMCGQGTSWPNCFVSYPANLDQTEQIITLQCPK